jgi:hypothetical protein
MENSWNFDACKLGAALHFEFYAEGDAFDSCDDRKVSRPQVIHIPQLHMQTEGTVSCCIVVWLLLAQVAIMVFYLASCRKLLAPYR